MTVRELIEWMEYQRDFYAEEVERFKRELAAREAGDLFQGSRT